MNLYQKKIKINYRGDPKQQVMQLIKQQSISQDRFNIAVEQANQIYTSLNGR